MFLNDVASSAAPRLQIFVSDLSTTGVVRNAIAIANSAAAAGYQVRLLTCHPDGPLRSHVSAEVTLVGLLPEATSRTSRSFQLKQALTAYRRHSREWRPDIMLSSGNHAHLLSTIAWIGLPGSKVVRMSNDLNHGSPSWITRIWRDLKFRFVATRADRLVLNSRALGDHPVLARHVASGKAIVIPNGVDVDAVRKAAAQPCLHPWLSERSIPVALVVARHVKQKNLDVMIRAFAKARRQRPLRLIFLGHANEAETHGLRSRADELSIRDDVDFVAATSNPFPYMAAASVLALPSLWEGSSNVLLEAMACGTPVIASRTAGDAEYVLGSGRFGILIDPQDEDGLAAALLRQTGTERIEPGRRASSFDRQEALGRYVGLFDQLMGQRTVFGPVSVSA